MDREPRDWTDGDIAFLTALATHASIALNNAELFEQTEMRAAQLAVLQAASGRLNRASSVETVGSLAPPGPNTVTTSPGTTAASPTSTTS